MTNARHINAIDPNDGLIKKAMLISGHFGRGMDAVNFGGLNTPYYNSNTVAWEMITYVEWVNE